MGSFLVIGMGRFGSSLATELFRMKHEVLVLDNNEENISDIVDGVTDVIIGDARDEVVLRSLGIHNFDCAVVAIAGDHVIEDSILSTMILKELGAKMIVCKASDERHARILLKLGADKVIRPEFDMGKRAAHSLIRKNVIDYLDIAHGYGIIEIIAPKDWVGKSIAKNNLRRKYGINLIAINSKEKEKIKFSPNADTVISEGDILMVIGTNKDLETISMIQ